MIFDCVYRPCVALRTGAGEIQVNCAWLAQCNSMRQSERDPISEILDEFVGPHLQRGKGSSCYVHDIGSHCGELVVFIIRLDLRFKTLNI